MADGILTPCNVARSWHWFRQVTAPCNMICGSGMTCHWIRPNVRHIGILSCFDFDHITVVDMSFCTSLRNFIQIVSDTLVYYSFHQPGITMKGMSVAATYRFRTQYYSYKLQKITYKLFGNCIGVGNIINTSNCFQICYANTSRNSHLVSSAALHDHLCIWTFFISLLRPYTMFVSCLIFPVSIKIGPDLCLPADFQTLHEAIERSFNSSGSASNQNLKKFL